MTAVERRQQGHVLVGIPTMRSTLTADLAAFVCLLPVQGKEIGYRFTLQLLPGVCPVHYARNLLVESLLASDADRLWFIDDDMIPDESAVAMLDVDADIVVGRSLAFQTHRDGIKRLAIAAYARRSSTSTGFEMIDSTVETLAPIVGGGAGNLLVHRRVFEDPRMRLPPEYRDFDGNLRSLDDDPEAAPAIFRTPQASNGRILLGEDIDFVYRAVRLGYRCTYQPAAKMGHLKAVNLADLERYLEDEVTRALVRERSPNGLDASHLSESPNRHPQAGAENLQGAEQTNERHEHPPLHQAPV